jgi:hypothetical protein
MKYPLPSSLLLEIAGHLSMESAIQWKQTSKQLRDSLKAVQVKANGMMVKRCLRLMRIRDRNQCLAFPSAQPLTEEDWEDFERARQRYLAAQRQLDRWERGTWMMRAALMRAVMRC